MKTKYLFIPVLLLMFFSACNRTEFDALELKQLSDAERWQTTHTIQQLIDEFSTGESDYPVRSNSGDKDLFRVDTIRNGGSSVVISGRVVSADVEGNIYKSLYIQEAGTAMGLKISINVSSSSAVFPIGQLIHIKCNGLVIGKYGDVFQLGSLYKNNDSDTRKQGYEPGRIPYPILKEQVQLDGMPDASKIIVTDMTIVEIKASDRSVHSKLVRIRNAHFTGYGQVNFNRVLLTSAQRYFGLPKPTITGVPIAREISDGTGTINIATSEYAKFAVQPLPENTMKGDIIVIVGWYWDNVGSAQYPRVGSWQLTLRSLNDLGTGFEEYLKQINYTK